MRKVAKRGSRRPKRTTEIFGRRVVRHRRQVALLPQEQARQKVVGAINDLITGKDDLEGTVEKILKDAKKIVKPKKNTQKEDNEDKKD